MGVKLVVSWSVYQSQVLQSWLVSLLASQRSSQSSQSVGSVFFHEETIQEFDKILHNT